MSTTRNIVSGVIATLAVATGVTESNTVHAAPLTASNNRGTSAATQASVIKVSSTFTSRIISNRQKVAKEAYVKDDPKGGWVNFVKHHTSIGDRVINPAVNVQKAYQKNIGR